MNIFIPVAPVKQEKSMDCWIACYTILRRWKLNDFSFQINEAANELGEPFKTFYDTNSGLPSSEIKNFIARGQLEFDNPQNYTTGGWFNLLTKKGPLFIISASDLHEGQLIGLHARVLVGLNDEADQANPDFTYIDPDPATADETTLSFTQFLQLYEAIPSNQLNLIQVIYNS